MNKYYTLSFLCLIIGIIFFFIGIFAGDVEAGFVLIFPFLVGSGPYAVLGFLFMFIAIILFMFGFASTTRASIDLPFDEDTYDIKRKKSVKGGGVILIGPIPIVFGTSWKIAVLLMIAAIILIFTIYVFF